MAWKCMKLPGESLSSSNISSGLGCRKNLFATLGRPQGRLCTEKKKMMWHLRPLQILALKTKKLKSMVHQITSRGHALRSQKISFTFFVHSKLPLSGSLRKSMWSSGIYPQIQPQVSIFDNKSHICLCWSVK